jgi:hypothetical protein
MNGSDVIVRQDGDLVTTSIDGELVAMSVEQGACYGFDAVATRLWELLGSPLTLDALCAQLVGEFAVEEAACRSDVRAFLKELRGEGLISVTPAR